MKRVLQIIPSLLIITLSIISCGNNDQAELQKMEDEMMAIHDEVMPEWMNLMTLSNKLVELIDKPQVPNEKRTEFTKAIDGLESAYNGMRDWMNGIKRLDALTDKSSEEIKAYFTAETKKIEAVNKEMKENLALGNKLLEAYKTAE